MRAFRHRIGTVGCSAVTVRFGTIGAVSTGESTDRERTAESQSPVPREVLGPWSGHGAGLVCALCAGPGDGEVLEHRMTHGVAVSLCQYHRSDQFQIKDGGHDLVDALTTMWRAAGCLTPQRQRALAAHTRRVAPKVSERPCPGSYSWPQVREEAEQRWAAGHPPVQVMHELRQLHSGWSAVVPSLRTMRRWFQDARWLNPPPRTDPPRAGERALAWIADQNRTSRQLMGTTVLPGWPEHDRWGRPYRRR